LQLCGAPRYLLSETRIANVFATAHNSVFRCHRFQFRTKAECPIHGPRKAPRPVSIVEQFSRFRQVASGSEAGNLTLDDRCIHASNARRFTCAEDALDRRLLEIVNLHALRIGLAAQQLLQFKIRNQMKAAGKIVALVGFGTLCVIDCDTPKSSLTMRRGWPTIARESDTRQVSPQLDSLPDFFLAAPPAQPRIG
jgi:hypothetical protein